MWPCTTTTCPTARRLGQVRATGYICHLILTLTLTRSTTTHASSLTHSLATTVQIKSSHMGLFFFLLGHSPAQDPSHPRNQTSIKVILFQFLHMHGSSAPPTTHLAKSGKRRPAASQRKGKKTKRKKVTVIAATVLIGDGNAGSDNDHDHDDQLSHIHTIRMSSVRAPSSLS